MQLSGLLGQVGTDDDRQGTPFLKRVRRRGHVSYSYAHPTVVYEQRYSLSAYNPLNNMTTEQSHYDSLLAAHETHRHYASIPLDVASPSKYDVNGKPLDEMPIYRRTSMTAPLVLRRNLKTSGTNLYSMTCFGIM